MMESSDTEEKEPPQKAESHHPKCGCEKCSEYRYKVKYHTSWQIVIVICIIIVQKFVENKIIVICVKYYYMAVGVKKFCAHQNCFITWFCRWPSTATYVSLNVLGLCKFQFEISIVKAMR